jgi:hypothetical protein
MEVQAESSQTLKVLVWAKGLVGSWETFYARIDRSEAHTVPRLVQNELLRTSPILQCLVGAIVQVRLEPAKITKTSQPPKNKQPNDLTKRRTSSRDTKKRGKWLNQLILLPEIP